MYPETVVIDTNAVLILVLLFASGISATAALGSRESGNRRATAPQINSFGLLMLACALVVVQSNWEATQGYHVGVLVVCGLLGVFHLIVYAILRRDRE